MTSQLTLSDAPDVPVDERLRVVRVPERKVPPIVVDGNGRKRTSGVWRRDDAPLYFRAGLHSRWSADDLARFPEASGVFDGAAALLSLFEFGGAVRNGFWDRWSSEPEWPLLLDSGVFSLYNRALRRDGVAWGELPASEFVVEDDREWPKLKGVYDKVFGADGVERRVWGAIETDAGDWEMKTERRLRMEDEYGFCFIPVFHVGSDPWSYLDFLLRSYDRVAVGFIYVQKGYSGDTELGRVLLELFERWDGSGVWMHLLAFSLNRARTFIPDSFDSTAWRYPSIAIGKIPAALWTNDRLGNVATGFDRRMGSDDHWRTTHLTLASMIGQQVNLRTVRAGRVRLGDAL